MKKLVFSILACTLAVGAFAQDGASKLRFGLRLSPVIASAQFKDKDGKVFGTDGKGSRMGISYGLMVIYQMADNFGLQTGLNWVDKGYRVSTSGYKANSKLSQLEIPLALRLRSRNVGPESLGMKIRGLVGLSADVSIATKTKTEVSNTTVEVTDLKPYNPVGASTLFGLGVEWDIEKVGLFDLGVSYHRGITNVWKTNNTYNTAKNKARYDYWSIDIGYLF